MSDIGSTPMTKDPSKCDETKIKFLRTREVVLLGATGGILVNLVAHPGLLKLDFSHPKEILGSILIGAVLGGIWAYVNMPEYDRKRALQFGMIAPAVFVSFTFGLESMQRPQEKPDNKKIEKSQKEDKKGHFSIIGKAYATTQPSISRDLNSTKTRSGGGKTKKPWWIRIFR
ncbi:MAG: hypothetical protein OXE44_16175 [Nitrospinae bacterium]|nr:hypothetical protein [Nitrospinota bacterium]